jgi:hypothetical protein
MRIYSISGLNEMMQFLVKQGVELYDKELFLSQATLEKLPEKDINDLGEDLFNLMLPMCPELEEARVPWGTFKRAMTFLYRQNVFENEAYDLIRNYRDVVGDAEGPMFASYTVIENLITEVMGLPIEMGSSDIDWWAFDCGFGEDKTLVNSIVDERFPKNSEFRKPCLDNLNSFYRYLCAISALIRKNEIS